MGGRYGALLKRRSKTGKRKAEKDRKNAKSLTARLSSWFAPPKKEIRVSKVTTTGAFAVALHGKVNPFLENKNLKFAEVFAGHVFAQVDQSTTNSTMVEPGTERNATAPVDRKLSTNEIAETSFAEQHLRHRVRLLSSTKDELGFELEFEAKQYVTQRARWDRFYLTVTKPHLFEKGHQNMTQAEKKAMEPIVFIKDLPAQLDKAVYEQMDDTLSRLKAYYAGIAVINWLVLLFVGGSATAYWSGIRTLQLKTYLSLLPISVPAVMVVFNSFIIKIANTDLVGQYAEEAYAALNFRSSPPFSPLFEQFDIGGLNIVENSGSMLVLLAYSPLRIAGSIVINRIAVRCRRYKCAR